MLRGVSRALSGAFCALFPRSKCNFFKALVQDELQEAFGMEFGTICGGFGSDLGANMDEKSVQKRYQKHVGIALEVKLAKTSKLIPRTAFFKVFQIKLGPKSIRNG